MLDDLRGLVVFAEVVDGKSFAHAANSLGMTRSAVSKHVAQLEERLGVQLLSRTTRKLSLTEVGERVYAASKSVRDSAERAREAAHTHQGVVEGTLRITAPVGLGRIYLIPLADALMKLHPRLEVALILSDHYVDLVEQRIDVALRVGHTIDSSLVTRRIAPVPTAFCAAPSYLAARGTPHHPRELGDHEWVHHLPRVEGARLKLSKGRTQVEVQPKGRLSCNDGSTSVAAALAGMGVVSGPEFEFAHEVRAGRLVQVLVGWTMDVGVLHLVSPPRRHVSSKVRTFAEFVDKHWRRPPWSLASDG